MQYEGEEERGVNDSARRREKRDERREGIVADCRLIEATDARQARQLW